MEYMLIRWLYYPEIEPRKRLKPKVVENIPLLKRKEQSIYKPTDLQTTEDDLLLPKYGPNALNAAMLFQEIQVAGHTRY